MTTFKMKTCPMCKKGYCGIGRSSVCLDCRPSWRSIRKRSSCETLLKADRCSMVLGLFQKLDPYHVWTVEDVCQYLHWLQSQHARATLKNKLAGLIHDNLKRYREQKRAEIELAQKGAVA